MWIVIAVAGLCLGTGIAFSVLCLCVESRANRMERRARDIVVWSVESSTAASIQAHQAVNGPNIRQEHLRVFHGWVVDKAIKLGRDEGLDVANALGGRNVLEACAWVALTGRV